MVKIPELPDLKLSAIRDHIADKIPSHCCFQRVTINSLRDPRYMVPSILVSNRSVNWQLFFEDDACVIVDVSSPASYVKKLEIFYRDPEFSKKVIVAVM